MSILPPQKKISGLYLERGISDNDIVVTGNTVIDALMMCKKKMTPESNPEILKLQGIYEPKKKLLLVTGHRRENIEPAFWN